MTATVFSGSGASLTSIPNSALTNSSVTIGSTAVSLGATVTTIAGLVSVSSTTFVGALTGNASTATTATTATNATNTAITDNTSSSATWYPTIVSTTTGNLPQTTSSTKLSFVPSTGVLSANGVDLTGNLGTVTSVAALTLGTIGTDLTSTVATGTTTPVITLNVPTASASNRGALSSADWTTFNNKQPAGSYLTASTGVTTFAGNSTGLTPTAATSGAITLGGTLNVANGGTGTTTAFTAGSVVFAGASGVYSQSNSGLFFDSTQKKLGINTATVGSYLTVAGDGSFTISTASASTPIIIANNNTTGVVTAKLAFQNGGGTKCSINAAVYGNGYMDFSVNADTFAQRIHASTGVSIGNTTDPGAGGLKVSGLIYPQQAATASAPAYVKGAIYFDTTLNKLRVGGASAWETITSV